MNQTKPCELCRVDCVPRKSHVVPAFVTRWIRETSPGKMRTVAEPNRRIQDGPTEEWLCDRCEQLFSDWEKPFAEQIFQPVHTNSATRPLRYSAWALKFAASISWRTLRLYRDTELAHLSVEDKAGLERAEQRWRAFLLGHCPHPGEFEQHMLLVDTLASAPGSVSPFINRYFLRTIHTDIVATRSTCITYAKLCRVIIVGFVRSSSRSEWKGTRLHVHSGHVGSHCKVPGFLATYWNDKANQAAGALASLSEKQRGKISDVFAHADLDELGASEVFRAMEADVEFSGDMAFSSTKPSRDDESGVG